MPEPRGVEIRAATDSDLPLILALVRELAEYEHLSHEVVATEAGFREALFGERRVPEVLVGHVDEEPAGFALFFHSFSTFIGRPGIYLEDLYVRPDFRGAGLGKAFLKRLASLARDRGCGRLEWSVLKWNEPAIRFYDSLGATPMDGWTVYRLAGEELRSLSEHG
jgi:GNAT superfamily N-acetyltransferase